MLPEDRQSRAGGIVSLNGANHCAGRFVRKHPLTCTRSVEHLDCSHRYAETRRSHTPATHPRFLQTLHAHRADVIAPATMQVNAAGGIIRIGRLVIPRCNRQIVQPVHRQLHIKHVAVARVTRIDRAGRVIRAKPQSKAAVCRDQATQAWRRGTRYRGHQCSKSTAAAAEKMRQLPMHQPAQW